MAISDVLAKLLELLGLKSSEMKKWLKVKQSLLERKSLNQDRLEVLKDEIGRLERKILKNKSEHEIAHGDTKRIIGREIEQLFNELDQSRGREDILVRNLEQTSLALAKIEEILAGFVRSPDATIGGGELVRLRRDPQNHFRLPLLDRCAVGASPDVVNGLGKRPNRLFITK